MENKFKVTCFKCKQRFSAVVPQPGILNDLRVSLLVASHEKPVRCICGQEYVLVAQGGAIDWSIQPLADEQSEMLRGSRIVTPEMLTVN